MECFDGCVLRQKPTTFVSPIFEDTSALRVAFVVLVLQDTRLVLKLSQAMRDGMLRGAVGVKPHTDGAWQHCLRHFPSLSLFQGKGAAATGILLLVLF